MSSAMTRLFRLPGLTQLVPRRGLASKPAHQQVGVLDSAIGLTAFFAVFLVPSGWILMNLENYKKRD